MRKITIISTAHLPLRFVTTEIFGGDLLIIGESAAEVNVEGIIGRLYEDDPELKKREFRIIWVTRAEDSLTGCRMLRELYLPGPGASSFDWGTDLFSFEHQTEDLQNVVLACEALLAAPE